MRQHEKSIDPNIVNGQELTQVTLDFETYYDQEYSLSKMSTAEYIMHDKFEVIGVGVKIGRHPATTQWAHGYTAVCALLDSIDWYKARLVAHNVMFDGAILGWIYGHYPARYMCTMMASRPNIFPYTNSMSLDAVGGAVTLGALNKGTFVKSAKGIRGRDFTPEMLDGYGEYCVVDVDLCYAVDNYIALTEEEYLMVHETIRKFIKPQLRLDDKVIGEAIMAEHEAQQRALAAANVDDPAVLASNPKFAAALVVLGVDPPTKISAATGKQTYAFAKTDAGMMELMNHPDSHIRALTNARLATKSTIERTRLTRFGLLSECMHGQLPWPMLYWGAHTGRMSGLDKLNLQNLTNGSALRRAIVVADGMSLLAPDLSQIEARLLAWFADQNDLVSLFRGGMEVYGNFASIVYGYDVNKVDHPNERDVGKAAVLGLGYGMGVDRFDDMLYQEGLSDMADAASVVATYRQTYPMIKKLWRRAEAWLEAMAVGREVTYKCITTGHCMLHLPDGRILHYPNLRKDENGDWEYQRGKSWIRMYGAKLIENIVQALAQLVIRDAELRILKSVKIHAAGQIHDELLYVVPTRLAEKYASVLVQLMKLPPAWAPDLPLDCECGIGLNYADAK